MGKWLLAAQNSRAFSCARWLGQITTEKPNKFLFKKINHFFSAKKSRYFGDHFAK